MSDVDPYASINLGQKRKSYNECTQYGIDTDQPIISVDIAGADVEKMMAIDIACAKADLRYILDTLAHEDMLYVSRTIKDITWMINDQKYATIIHPDYIQSNLQPKMTAKAANKLMKHIRLHLKDETRVEAFYSNEKNVTEALKWLPKCSVPFIEQEVKKHVKNINPNILKRLTEKSTSIWKIVMMHKDTEQKRSAFNSTLFVLYRDTDLFMDVIEETKWYELPDLGVKGTHVIMKGNYKRVMENLSVYMRIMNIPTFAKCLKSEEVKDVLYKIAKECDNTKNRTQCERYSIFKFRNLIQFIQRLPLNERYTFVKELFIDKVHSNEGKDPESDKMAKIYTMCKHLNIEDYFWYEFAHFEEAFAPIKECIQKETRQYERNSMLKTILICTRSNMKYIKDVLQYFNDKLINDKAIDKEDFINRVLSTKIPIQKYDEDTWALLHEIFKSIDVYKESTDISQKFIEIIIVYNVIKNKNVPEVLEKKFEFNTLKQYGNQMSQAEKDKLFTYLYNYNFAKLESCKVNNESSFKDKTDRLYKVLLTIKDWKKELADYTILLDKIRECIQTKNENSWKADLSKLYNINKHWKKLMFEESLILNPTEEVCLNAIKHDAGLLKRNENVFLDLTRNDKISLRKLLSKIRIFWNQTLAKEWAEAYLSRLNEGDDLQATVRGLCTVLPQNQLLDLIKTYAPQESQINWEESDSLKISVQRNIAKKMHSARPQPPPEAVLLYAKGDYLQYALPSVLAIFYNLSPIKTRDYIPKLFDAPVSLQKHGLRLAVSKMNHEDVINTFSNILKTSKNATIRAVIFKLTFKLLSKEKDAEKTKNFWDFLSTIIENLSFEEDSTVYEQFVEVDKVPISVRAQYVEKAYNFLKKMLLSASGDDRKNLEKIIERILDHVNGTEIQLRNPTFMIELLKEFVEELKVKPFDQILRGEMKISILSIFLLLSDTDEAQNEKFHTLCKPYITCVQNPGNKSLVSRLQEYLRRSLVNTVQTGMVIPEILFSQMYGESLKILPVSENYVLLTEMRLFAALMKILKNVKKENPVEDKEEQKDESVDDDDSKTKKYFSKILNITAKDFGNVCVTYLKEDIDAHFPLIYELFSKSLNNVCESFDSLENGEKIFRNGFCTSMLQDKDFTAAYLVVLKLFSNDSYYSMYITKPENNALLKLVLENESVEVRMHYYNMNSFQYA